MMRPLFSAAEGEKLWFPRVNAPGTNFGDKLSTPLYYEPQQK
jgi:hypothetical protein